MNITLKPSNIPWTDYLPIEWEEACLRWYASLYAGGTPSKAVESYWENGTIPWLNSGSVNEEVITEPSAFITEEAFNNSSAKWIPKGSLLMALAGQGKTKGMVAQLSFDATCNQSMAAILPNEKLEPRFLYYWLKANYQNIRNMGGGDLRDGLNLEMLASIKLPLPPLDTQQSIVEYLDDELSRISSLIYEKQTLISLLKEKRQALISHYVTKGIDDNVPMKDSGVEWIGAIPESWSVRKLNSICSILTCGVAATPDYVESGIPFLSAQNVKGGRVDLSKGHKFITEDFHTELTKNRKPTKGDILLTRVGTIGEVGIVDVDFEFSVFVSLTHIRLIPTECTAQFFKYLFESKFVKELNLAVTLTGAGVGNLNVQDLREYRLPLPDIATQEAIVEALDNKVNVIERLIDETEKSVTLLKEHRTALISAAVTGKIDVLGMVDTNGSAA